MQIQNGPTQNQTTVSDARNQSGMQQLDANAVTLPTVAVVDSSTDFEKWASSSPKLAAIVEVSKEIAGELPSFESYVALKNEALKVAIVYGNELATTSITPRELNYQAKLREREESLAQAA